MARFREQKSYVCVNCGIQLLLLTVHAWQAEFWRHCSILSTLLTQEPCFYFHFSISLNTRCVQICVHMHRVTEISIFLSIRLWWLQFVSAHLSKCSHTSTFYKSSRVSWQQVFVLFSNVFFNFMKFFDSCIYQKYHQADMLILVLKHKDYSKVCWSGLLSHCISSFFLCVMLLSS